MSPTPTDLASSAEPAHAGAPASRTVQPSVAGQPLSSDALLAGRTAVTIEHLGERYVLRATRSGKLILTK
ncbi:hemin uptake protein HemP [Thauera humireducens]|jgi:hemin uptake protein HemP|uniref:Hemin transporter HemP n=1 Tax=Thauera humireducens TaxID=1134435 RepID=A0A127K6L8_9RHOO|nr:hemin uptake protein HemP [Thauera humireducens]AMO37607.1 hypothetical protein AC731_012040 [Thauera humireducens]